LTFVSPANWFGNPRQPTTPNHIYKSLAPGLH